MASNNARCPPVFDSLPLSPIVVHLLRARSLFLAGVHVDALYTPFFISLLFSFPPSAS